MQSRERVARAARGIMLVLLAGAAGCLDAASYLGLGHVFTANMTGNSVLLAMALGRGERAEIVRSGIALAGFFIGAGIGAWIVERRPEESVWPRGVTRALAIECAVLIALAAAWRVVGTPLSAGVTAHPLIVLSALAMGMQSAAVRRLDVSGVATTYLTGTLTTLVMRIVGRYPVAARPAHHIPVHHTALLWGVWLTYIAGAIVISTATTATLPFALILPVALLLIVVITASLLFGPPRPAREQHAGG